MTAAAFSGDGSVLAVAAETVITLWDPLNNVLVAVIGDSLSVSICSQGMLIVTRAISLSLPANRCLVAKKVMTLLVLSANIASCTWLALACKGCVLVGNMACMHWRVSLRRWMPPGMEIISS